MMNNNIKVKERISELLDFVEKANTEMKSVQEETAGLQKEMANKDLDIEKRKDTAAVHFAKVTYGTLLANDIRAAMSRVAETFLISNLLGLDLQLSKEESAIVNGYIKENAFVFVINNGVLKTKEEGLLDLMTKKSMETLRNAPFIDSYLNQ